MYQLAGWGQETDLTELLVGRQDQRNKNGITPPEEELEIMKLHPWRQFWGGFVRGPSVENCYSGTHRPWRGRGSVLKTNKAIEEVSGEKTGAAQMASPGLVPASQFAFEQRSRCRVMIRKKAPGACEAARPTTQQTSRSAQGGRAVDSAWAASPAFPSAG